METPGDWIMGHGYGFSLGALMVVSGSSEALRTPHNFAIYLLGYTGLVGCALYLCVLLGFAREVINCTDSRSKDAIIAGGLSVLVMALSGNLLETPFGAVPIYLVFGILLGVARKWNPAIHRRWPQESRRLPLSFESPESGETPPRLLTSRVPVLNLQDSPLNAISISELMLLAALRLVEG